MAEKRKYTSRGERKNVDRTVTLSNRADYMNSPERVLNQLKALAKGQDVVYTIDNPNKEKTAQKKLRVRVSGKGYTDALRAGTRMLIQKDAK